MTDYLLCCFYYNRSANQQHHSGKFAIRNIDKSMIGLPTNFQHCAHIGCSDVLTSSSSSSSLSPMRQNIPPLQQGYYLDAQMKSKAGFVYNTSSLSNVNSGVIGNSSQSSPEPFVAHLKLIDLKIS